MKVAAFALSLLVVPILNATDLKLVCSGGWESYLLQIDFDTGEARYTPRDAKKPEIYKLPDYKKVGTRVKTLVERVPRDLQRSFGEDVTRYFISFHDEEMVKELTIGRLGPPDEELCTLLDEIVSDLRQSKYKHAADLKVCPDGHKALKDVPILWGRFGVHYKKPEDYNDEDRKMAERVRKGEVFLGGDLMVGDPPPNTKVICKECGFAFDPDLEGSPKWDTWSKNRKKPDDFKIPFTKTLLGFPLLEPTMASLDYSQMLDGKGRILQWEDVRFQTPQKIDQVLTTVRKWMTQHQRNPGDLKRNTKAFAYHNYNYRDNYIWISIQEDTFWNPGQICVSLSLRPAEAKKPIEVTRALDSDPFATEQKTSTNVPSTADPFSDAPNASASKEPSSKP